MACLDASILMALRLSEISNHPVPEECSVQSTNTAQILRLGDEIKCKRQNPGSGKKRPLYRQTGRTVSSTRAEAWAVVRRWGKTWRVRWCTSLGPCSAPNSKAVCEQDHLSQSSMHGLANKGLVRPHLDCHTKCDEGCPAKFHTFPS